MGHETTELDKNHIFTIRDVASQYKDFLNYSNDLQTVDGMITKSSPDEKTDITRLLQSVHIQESKGQIQLSVSELLKQGFEIQHTESILTLARENRNKYIFTSQIEATKEQCALSGYFGSKPVYLQELGTNIDPYRLGEFLEWLVLQKYYFKQNLPESNDLSFLKSKGREPHLYIVNDAVHVFMGDVVAGSRGKIETWGLGPCVGIVITGQRFGLMAHITSFQDPVESAKLISHMISHGQAKTDDLKCAIFGGHSETQDDKDYLDPILRVIKDTLNSERIRVTMDKSGEVASQLTLNIDTQTITVQMQGSSNFQDILI